MGKVCLPFKKDVMANNESLDEQQKQQRKKRQPGQRCVMFCNKTNADGVSLHQFPADENVIRQGIAFVRSKREPSSWTPGSGHICSAHFTDDSYEGFGAKLAGFSSKLVLRKSAVPSIQPAPTPEQLGTVRRVKRKLPLSEEKPNSEEKDPEKQSYTTPKKKSRALSKLTANRVRAFLCNVPLIWGLRVLGLLLLHFFRF